MTLSERLRAALAAPAPPRLLAGDFEEQESGVFTPAAVLIAVTLRDQPGVILTVRRDDMRTHAGQIAFPGGRIDPGETAVEAALREAWEELELDPAETEPIAELESYRTITGYLVAPVVATIPPDLPLRPHDREVADWFEAPLAHLLDSANHKRQAVLFEGKQRHYYEIDWEGRRIWGATAAMIVNLSRRLQWS